MVEREVLLIKFSDSAGGDINILKEMAEYWAKNKIAIQHTIHPTA